MTDRSTSYLGLPLRHPVVASAGPLSHDLDGIRRIEDGDRRSDCAVLAVRGADSLGERGSRSVDRRGRREHGRGRLVLSAGRRLRGRPARVPRSAAPGASGAGCAGRSDARISQRHILVTGRFAASESLATRVSPRSLISPGVDVADAIRSLAALRVSVEMITGDNEPVPRHLAAWVDCRPARPAHCRRWAHPADRALR